MGTSNNDVFRVIVRQRPSITDFEPIHRTVAFKLRARWPAIVRWENADYLKLMRGQGCESWPKVRQIAGIANR